MGSNHNICYVGLFVFMVIEDNSYVVSSTGREDAIRALTFLTPLSSPCDSSIVCRPLGSSVLTFSTLADVAVQWSSENETSARTTPVFHFGCCSAQSSVLRPRFAASSPSRVVDALTGHRTPQQSIAIFQVPESALKPHSCLIYIDLVPFNDT
ncbi:hypothetical protein Cgig2_028181 [Carnegiea gigantea]|uniref:Uncharacterized protein n=1 Tax=Carnegiea gigantea TaxID=171969 RepID=A0A9Q1GVC7_9CARY|nr:hypothetical protein Cgig2_028181 [Carnegiea gigantea]